MKLKPLNDYCALLGVTRNATERELKQAYRAFARKLHPDINPCEEAAKLFSAINEAYEVLADPLKRRLADFGMSSSFDAKAAQCAPQTSVAEQTRAFLRNGGIPTYDMLFDALRASFGVGPSKVLCDSETAKMLLQAGVVPDEKMLTYAVENLNSFWVATFIKEGGKPTPAMLQYAVDHRLEYVAKELLKGGVPATPASMRLVQQTRQPGWGWG